jgi:flagellar biosynthesis/type III secretory pathway M-ring protein FliF/YscJ
MNRIQQFAIAIRRFTETMTPGLRVVALLLIVAIVISFNLLFQSTASTTQFLFDGRGFTESELHSIEIAFAKAKLSEYEIVGRRLRVPAKLYAEYVTAFDNAGVKDPIQSYATEQIYSPNIFESNVQKENRIHHAAEQDLARNIRTLPGIEDAFVRVNIKQEGGLQRTVSAAASVNVKCESADVLNADTAQTIRMIVADCYPALEPINVNVIDLVSKRKYPAGVATDAAANDPMARRQAIENFWQQKLASSLQSYEGVQIVVNVAPENEPITGATEQFRVFVNVPTSFYVNAWQSRNQLSTGVQGAIPDPDDLKVLREKTESKIEQVVQGLCGTAVVTVQTFDDSISRQPESPDRLFDLFGWLKAIWPLVAAAGALCFFVWNVRTGLRSQNADPTPRPRVGEQSRRPETVSDEASFDHPATVDLRERLSAVVRSDPDAAAQVLQNWMKEAS